MSLLQDWPTLLMVIGCAVGTLGACAIGIYCLKYETAAENKEAPHG